MASRGILDTSTVILLQRMTDTATGTVSVFSLRRCAVTTTVLLSSAWFAAWSAPAV